MRQDHSRDHRNGGGVITPLAIGIHIMRGYGYSLDEIYRMDIDDFRSYLEYEYILKMSEQIRQYQIAGYDVTSMPTYREFLEKYDPRPQLDLDHEAQEFKPIFDMLKREKRWQTKES